MPSTEILEAFSQYGGRAQWLPNEKVALDVAKGRKIGSYTVEIKEHQGDLVALFQGMVYR